MFINRFSDFNFWNLVGQSGSWSVLNLHIFTSITTYWNSHLNENSMKMFITQRKTSLGTHFLGHVSESQISLNNYDLFFFFCIDVANNCTFGIFDIFALFKITLSLSLLSLSASSKKNFWWYWDGLTFSCYNSAMSGVVRIFHSLVRFLSVLLRGFSIKLFLKLIFEQWLSLWLIKDFYVGKFYFLLRSMTLSKKPLWGFLLLYFQWFIKTIIWLKVKAFTHF